MNKYAIQMGKSGSLLGVLVGFIELSIGSKILIWIGNKENPAILGIITILLSIVGYISVRSADNQTNPTNDRKLAIFLGVFTPAIICFTTIGKLWYLPGILLIVTSSVLGYEYWFRKSRSSEFNTIFQISGLSQIIGILGSIMILASIVLALSNSASGLFEGDVFIEIDHFQLEVLPIDFIRLTRISDNIVSVEKIEVRLLMIVHILLLLGSGIALIASFVKSSIFTGIGGILVFTSLLLFLVWLPGIFSQLNVSSASFENIIGSLGMGWYTSFVGMTLIMISSLFKIKRIYIKN